MSRVLVTGGTGAIGVAVVRRLLADPAYDVRVADRKPAPQWMREACEIAGGDLRELERASAAVRGCPYVVHLAAPSEQTAGDYSVIAESAALDSAILRAAVDHGVESLVYVSCVSSDKVAKGGALAEELTEHGREHDANPLAMPPRPFAKLLGERLCLAARAEHGLAFAIVRAPSAEETPVEEIAAELIAAIAGAGAG